MSKVPKPVTQSTGARTKKEIATRLKMEGDFRQLELPDEPPKYINTQQKRIYRFIVSQLKPSGYMCQLDTEMVVQAAITIDRLRRLDRMIDTEDGLSDRNLKTARETYFRQFTKISEELCMSPLARAKIGTLVANKKDDDPLLDVLGGEGK